MLMLKLETDTAIPAAGDYLQRGVLEIQFVDFVVGVIGDFRLGVNEPFTRRNFGLSLRER